MWARCAEWPGRARSPPGERIASVTLFDLAASWRVAGDLELMARVENLFDETYLAARRPGGARPGRPRAGFVGLRYRF